MEQDNEDFEEQPSTEQQGYSWARSTAVDRTLLVPTASSKRISVVMPKYAKRQVAVVIFDEDGKPFLTPEGETFYNMQTERVFVGYEARDIALPGQEIFNVDLTSSYLSEYDVPALRSLISLYADLQLQVLAGKDRIDDLYFVYSKAMGLVNSAKARDGKTAKLSKTTISEGSNKQELIEEYKKEQKQTAWVPGKH